jgi:hypothetical protein
MVPQHLNLKGFLTDSTTLERRSLHKEDAVRSVGLKSFFSPPNGSVKDIESTSPFSASNDYLDGDFAPYPFLSLPNRIRSKQGFDTLTKLSPPKLQRIEEIERISPSKKGRAKSPEFLCQIGIASTQATASPTTPIHQRFHLKSCYLPSALDCTDRLEESNFFTEDEGDNEEEEDELRYGPRRGGAGDNAWWCCVCSHFNKSGKSQICSNTEFAECGGELLHKQQMVRPETDRMLNHRRCVECDPRNFLTLWQEDRRDWPEEELTEAQQRDLELEADIQMRKADKAYFDEELRKNMRPRQVKRDFVTYRKIQED